MAECESDACIQWNIAGHQSLCVPAVGSSRDSGYRRCLELATQCVVERVSKARGAVVAIVVITIKLVLGQCVPLHELL